MERQDFLSFIEQADKFAVGIFRQFKIEERDNSVILIAPTEAYKRWAMEYIKSRVFNYGKRIEVRSAGEREKNEAYPSNLIEKYSFDNFVVGKANELVYKVCIEVAEYPGSSFNPLFIYGKVGLGKTHLLHAIGNRARDGGYKVIYSPITDFSDEMIAYLKKGQIEAFRNKYSSVDVLLLDDVQFLSGKERTQIELFRVFESIYSKDKQMVLVSDRHPKDLKDISDRLISRFESGLVIEIGLDDETKLSIIKQKLILYGMPLDQKVIDHIFENTGYNVREIEGAIKTLKVVGIKETPKKKSVKDINFVVEFTARHFKLKPEDLKKEGKERKIINARHIAMYLCKMVLGTSYAEISRYFGKKDHTSAIYSIRKVEEKIRQDRKFKYMMTFLERHLRKELEL
ncbi:chromosomal replication initiator protein DnaA [Hydrogenobacter thermophilus TK-6]|uniref:Chromosomal replication initiator protein DnaA n=1 Tax=Hydrogenobacter thermophilus (strain DSM 6534 / IAM 12695 / TK-6) TaxID=608538 RepID=D3DF66_HYDTT|nr:chromosomal replication initiator protein DnaA [Hydrogenobacter thermophilus]ADO44412.1 chromosomal replication initiator protein DnaA [Hydrogenobacter thermophilus TK-6]BAI68468.1 chromosomal replication initiation protein [Hydrogenobacter thermophilus TK-6]